MRAGFLDAREAIMLTIEDMRERGDAIPDAQ
jgi:predicted RNase H-like HicB family nuclease